MSQLVEELDSKAAREELVDELGTLHIAEDSDESDDDSAKTGDEGPAEQFKESNEEPIADAEDSEYVYEKDLQKALDAKEEGNAFFRNKDYDEALESYSKAITFCPEDDINKENLATFYGNRAAAYFSVEEYELVVEDCTAALALKSDYVKVIARRMLANEKLEKYEDALTGDYLQ
jgi:import receptor subunit TOM70